MQPDESARLRVRVDVTGALTSLELEGYAAAAALLAGARERAREAAASDLVALTHIQQGVIDARSGDWASARVELLEAVSLFDHLGAVEQCSTLITLGLADLSLRHLEDAIAHLGSAREIAAEHDLDAHEFKATHNLGCVHFVAGDLPRALSLMAQADAMPVDVARDRAQLDHAEALMDAGLVDEAVALLRSALDEATASGHRLDQGDILLDLARCAVLRDDRDAARRSARAAAAAFQTRQAGSRQALAELFLAGLDLSDGLTPELALAAAARWDTPTPRTAEEVEAALLVAEVHVAAGRPAPARAALDRVDTSGTLRLPVQIHQHYLRAVVAHSSGDDDGFGTAVRAASEILATAQSAAQSLELRASLAQHGSRLAQLDLSRSIDSGAPGAAIDTIERWRAVSARARDLTISRDPETSELLAELRWLSAPMSRASESDPALRAERTSELQREIARRAWRRDRLDGSSPGTATMTHDRLVEALPAGTAYLAFAETATALYAVLTDATGGGVLRPLGSRETIRAAVATVRRDLRGGAFAQHEPALHAMLRRALLDSAAHLDDLLLGPIAPDLAGADRLVIAPNDTLHAVPWSALPTIDHRPVTVTPSATRWARHPLTDHVRGDRVSVHTGPGLPEALSEVGQIDRIWGRRGTAVDAGERLATSHSVAAAMAHHTIVHVAAHGHHVGDNPLFSSLRLHDGPLFAHELAHDVSAEHVVLSACDVGQARVGVGGEALGMTAALLAFGVRCVVASVSPIADEASAAASVRYHELFAAGVDAAAALARAVQDTPGAESLMAFGSDVAVTPSGSRP